MYIYILQESWKERLEFFFFREFYPDKIYIFLFSKICHGNIKKKVLLVHKSEPTKRYY